LKAIILAAGRGSRMGNLTDEIPKCLIEINGKTLLDKQIESLNSAGIYEIGIVTGYRRDLLLNRNLTFFHNERWEVTNMVSSLACASLWLEKEPCIVSYSDIFYGYTGPFALAKSRAALAVCFDPNWLALWKSRFGDPLLDAEEFRLNSDGTVAAIGYKPASLDQIEGQYMGLLRVSPSGWEEIKRIRSSLAPSIQDQMHMTGTLQQVIDAKKVPVNAIPYVGEWGEVDIVSDLSLYTQSYKSL